MSDARYEFHYVRDGVLKRYKFGETFAGLPPTEHDEAGVRDLVRRSGVPEHDIIGMVTVVGGRTPLPPVNWKPAPDTVVEVAPGHFIDTAPDALRNAVLDDVVWKPSGSLNTPDCQESPPPGAEPGATAANNAEHPGTTTDVTEPPRTDPKL